MPHIPRLERRGKVTELIVEDAPFLILGGELGNSSASYPPELDGIFSKVRAMNLNTLLVPVYWDLTEREEGCFDFFLVKEAIESARSHDLRLVLLWFGAWKNSMSCYAPQWVKRDTARFQRVQTLDGTLQEILSPACPESLAADQRAYVALLEWLAEFDQDHRTVLMMQIENEIGMIPEIRDYSALSQASWDGSEGEEEFTARQFAAYVEALASAGKEVYPLPTFVNAALIRPGFGPGQYPSGGPLPHLMPIWKQHARSIDFLAPDIYFPNFVEWSEQYNQPENTMFVPEMAPSARMAANALHAIAALGSIGTCPFAIEDVNDEKAADLGQLYDLLSHCWSQLGTARAIGKVIGLTPRLDFDWQLKVGAETGDVGGVRFTATFDRTTSGGATSTSALPTHGNGRWEAPPGTPLGGVMLIQLAEDEYVALGKGVVLTFESCTGDQRVGIESAQAGHFEGGEWQGRRWLNGDQTHQGRHIHLYDGVWSMQRFKLYRY